MTPRSSFTLRPRTVLRWATAAAVAAAAGHLVAMRRDWVATRPPLFAALVAVAGVAAAGLVIASAIDAWRGPRRTAAIAELVGAAGVFAVAAGGYTNWAFAQQGALLVGEREPVRLSRRGDLAEFTSGPFADRRELELVVGLARLTLHGAGPDGFRVVSHLKVLDAAPPTGREPEEVALTVERGKPARFRSLVFRQGAFGFAPHVVVAKDGRDLLDAFVPFRTVREGPDGVSFVGEFAVDSEQLKFRGAVTLDDLNDDMKGHPHLELAAEREGKSLGAGDLKPGEYATLEGGYRVAFAGLRRWSEIDFSRRTYPAPMLGGVAAIAVSLVVGAVGWFRPR